MDEDQSAPPTPGVKRVMTDQGNKDQRLLRVDQIYSRKDRQTHFVKTAKTKPKPDRFGKTALVVRRIISNKGLVASTEVDIKSEALSNLMLDIFEGADGLTLNKTPPVADPELFFHARPHLIKRKEQEKDKAEPSQSLINDIGTALRFVEEDFGTRTQDLNSLIQNLEITWELLWALFPPKEEVIAPRHGELAQDQVGYLSEARYEQRPNGTKYLDVRIKVISHDGECFGWAVLSIEIDQYEGARKMTALPAHPFRYLPDKETKRKQLISRGHKYTQVIREPICQEYVASFAVRLDRKSRDIYIRDPSTRIKIAAKGRVMVDPEAFKLYGDMYELNEPYVSSASAIRRGHQFSDEQYIVCAYWVNGFCFPYKEWAQLSVADLADITWNEEAFSRLEITETRRRVVHGLVKAHRNNETSFDDIISDKGRGMVGLLCGSPGVGKTLTAEVVAEVTHRPLYTASGGELGSDPDKVDRRLQVILEITRRWACVLLIDEADVFLSKRGKSVDQDTLVSIFLRRLEYFQGVLILTTNRKDEIDPAFQSRIHFTLQYPDLDAEKRVKIWRNFIDNLAQDNKRLSLTDDELTELAKRPLNGRQIKNAVSCAISLAREEKKIFKMEDVKELLNVIIS